MKNSKLTTPNSLLTTKVAIMLALTIACLLLPQAAQAAEYCLDAVAGNDTNPGTSDAPWKTINYALGQKSPVVPGDTVYLRGGTYREQVEIRKYGTSDNWITVKSYPGETAIVDGTDPVIGWTQAQSDDSYLTVQGVVNPHFANIYWARVLDSAIPHTSGGIPLISTTMLFEDSTRCRIASDPNQSLGYGKDIREFRYVDSSSTGHKDYLIDTTLTQDDDYWNGALVQISLHNAINDIYEKTVAYYVKNDHKVIFDSDFDYAIFVDATHHDRYRLVNHPHILDNAGEFYVSAVETIGGVNYRRIYYWPTTVGNLTSKMSIAIRNYGLYQYGFAKDYYMVLDGLTIFGTRGYGIYIGGVSAAAPATNFIIRNCIVTDTGGKSLYYFAANHVRMENNYVRRSDDNGIMVSTADYCVLKGNNSGYNYRSGILLYNSTNSMMINNILYEIRGPHANGTTVYGRVAGGIVCENILLAGNIYHNVNMSLNDVNNLCVFGNTFSSDALPWPGNTAGGGITIQGSSVGTADGYMVFINNTIPVTPNFGLQIYPGNSGNIPHYYIVNNILHGLAFVGNSHWTQWNTYDAGYVVMEDRTYNAYTDYKYSQTAPSMGWSLQEGERDVRTIPFSSIFVDVNYPTSEDANLVTGSPLIHAGKNVQSILSSLGITAKFPEYDFSKDLAGNTWNSTPSIGCYEYGASSAVTGDINSDGSIDAIDLQLLINMILSGSYDSKADLNKDSSVDAVDLQALVNVILG